MKWSSEKVMPNGQERHKWTALLLGLEGQSGIQITEKEKLPQTLNPRVQRPRVRNGRIRKGAVKMGSEGLFCTLSGTHSHHVFTAAAP